jgi:hypothetical protein
MKGGVRNKWNRNSDPTLAGKVLREPLFSFQNLARKTADKNALFSPGKTNCAAIVIADSELNINSLR